MQGDLAITLPVRATLAYCTDVLWALEANPHSTIEEAGFRYSGNHIGIAHGGTCRGLHRHDQAFGQRQLTALVHEASRSF